MCHVTQVCLTEKHVHVCIVNNFTVYISGKAVATLSNTTLQEVYDIYIYMGHSMSTSGLNLMTDFHKLASI